MNTYYTSTGKHSTNHHNEYSYEHEDNKTLRFFVFAFFLILVVSGLALFSTITVHADGITDVDYSAWAYTVPTSLCHDPLLGPSMIIYSECGGNNEQKDKVHSVNKPVMPVVTDTPIVPIVTVEPPVVVEPPTEPIDPPVVDDKPEHKEKTKCNNGFGDGADSACKTQGNAQNQDNTGKHQNGKDMSKQMNKEK